MLKKLGLLLLIGLFVLVLVGCGRETPPEDIVQTEWEVPVELPSTDALEVATNPGIIDGAPDLMIIGAVLDTAEWYGPDNVLSAFEYLKVYNNTNQNYNMKGHRVILVSPLINGQIYDDLDTRNGDKVLCSNYIYMGYIDDDFIIPAKSIGLIWIHTYYWFVQGGDKGYTDAYSAEILYKDFGGKKGAFNQTVADFKEYWEMTDSNVPVYKLPNMGLVGKRGDSELYPMYTPGATQAFTHINSTLIRSFEIQKFNDQGGTAKLTLLNKYETLSAEEKINPKYIYGKQCFNAMEIKDNGETIDGYLWTNAWKYWDPVSRITFCGRVNVDTLEVGQTSVDFLNTANKGIRGLPHNFELQFRPSATGSKIMDWQLPLRELNLFDTYLDERHKNVLHFARENVSTYKYVEKMLKVSVDPATSVIVWKTDEIKTANRLSAASPTKIHTINLTKAPAA